jgi:hypothetical protein
MMIVDVQCYYPTNVSELQTIDILQWLELGT